MMPSRRPRSHQTSGHDFTDSARGTRLQKVLAEAGVAARRECEELIRGGAVTVNGHIVDTLPAWVDKDEDTILVYGKPLRRSEQHVYVVLFKPRGTVCTNSDPEGRPRAIDLVNHPLRPRLYCVGRLDLDTSGLLILTNDGEFANRLTHPRYEVTKGYDVTLDGSLDEERIEKLEREIFKAGRGKVATRSSLQLINRDRESTVVHLELAEHRNLQIRPLMLELGAPVKKLRRTSFGPLKLKGLAVGEWRDLTAKEVEQLRKASKHESIGGAMEPRQPRRTMAEAAVVREERAAARVTEPVEQDEGTLHASPASRGAAKPAVRTAVKSVVKSAVKSAGKPAPRSAADAKRSAPVDRGDRGADRGDSGGVRGGDRGVRGASGAVRGGERAVRGGERAVRGGSGGARGASGASGGVRGGARGASGASGGVRGGDRAVRGGSGGERAVRGASGGVRGGDRAVHGGERAVRGSSGGDRGGSGGVRGASGVVRGGERAVRGASGGVRGGERAVRGGSGGERAVRGASGSVRGGDRAVRGGSGGVRGASGGVRGGERAVRGGERAVGGGDRAVRGGDRGVGGGSSRGVGAGSSRGVGAGSSRGVGGGDRAVRGGDRGGKSKASPSTRAPRGRSK